jgi:hypothetical protein
MTNHPQQASTQTATPERPLRRAQQSLPVVRRKPVQTRPLSRLLADLKSLAELGGSALANAYAQAASSVLTGLEELEDRTAERRYRQQKAGLSRGAKVAALAPRSKEPLPPVT